MFRNHLKASQNVNGFGSPGGAEKKSFISKFLFLKRNLFCDGVSASVADIVHLYILT
jgi:hypothetical protein